MIISSDMIRPSPYKREGAVFPFFPCLCIFKATIPSSSLWMLGGRSVSATRGSRVCDVTGEDLRAMCEEATD